jgi:NADH-ubiquinone oxidoreductase chain 5
MRRYGGLINIIPFVYSALFIGSISLIAFPYLTGWYSKDGILEVAIGNYTITGGYIYTLGTIVAGFTAFYSIRLIYISFLTSPRSNYSNYETLHDANIIVIVPLIILSILSIILGYVSSDLFRGLGTDFLSYSSPLNINASTSQIDAEFASLTIFKLGPFISTILGIIISYLLYITNYGINIINILININISKNIYNFLIGQ